MQCDVRVLSLEVLLSRKKKQAFTNLTCGEACVPTSDGGVCNCFRSAAAVMISASKRGHNIFSIPFGILGLLYAR